MNVIDFMIIIFLLLGGSYGARNGVIKQSVVLIGTILCFVLSWCFKNPIANFLSFNLPFFNFAGDFEGLTSLNIVLYQLIAFLLLMIIFSSILSFIIKISGVIEKILNFTIILGIPSKILGFIVGVIESYVILFVVLFFLYQPVFNIGFINESQFASKIVNSSVGLSNIVRNVNDSVNEIYDLQKDYSESNNKKVYNSRVIDILLKHEVIDMEYVNTLKQKGKINY